MPQFCSPPSAASAQGGMGSAEQVTIHPNPAGATPTGSGGWMGPRQIQAEHIQQVSTGLLYYFENI